MSLESDVCRVVGHEWKEVREDGWLLRPDECSRCGYWKSIREYKVEVWNNIPPRYDKDI